MPRILSALVRSAYAEFKPFHCWVPDIAKSSLFKSEEVALNAHCIFDSLIFLLSVDI